jgi:hypothetical protein
MHDQKVCIVCGVKTATFSDGKTKRKLFCVDCKQPNSKYVLPTKVKLCECGKAQPSFRLPGKRTSIWCSSCPFRDPNCVSKNNKRRATKNKKTNPSFIQSTTCCVCSIQTAVVGFPHKSLCVSCAQTCAQNRKSTRCACNRISSFGIHGKDAICCVKCKSSLMVRNPKKRCAELHCPNLAYFGTFGRLHCQTHKGANEMDLLQDSTTHDG